MDSDRRLFYGLDPHGAVWLRLDPDPRRWPLPDGRLVVELVEPSSGIWELPLGSVEPRDRNSSGIGVAAEEIVEVRIPGELLGSGSGPIVLVLWVRLGEEAVQWIPQIGALVLDRVPATEDLGAW